MKRAEFTAACEALAEAGTPADTACMSEADARELFRDVGAERKAEHRAEGSAPEMAGHRWVGRVAGVDVFVPVG